MFRSLNALKAVPICVALMISSAAFGLDQKECDSLKRDNMTLGLIGDTYWKMSFYSAQTIVEKIDGQNLRTPEGAEFIGFHLGALQAQITFIGEILLKASIRTDSEMRVLSSEKQKISEAVNYERRDSWFQAIGCFRGAFRRGCQVQRGDKIALKAVLEDLIAAADLVSNSESYKQCYLK